MTTPDATRESALAMERIDRDIGYYRRIMDAIRRHSEGDAEALAGMGVPWVDGLLAERDALRARVAELEAVLLLVKREAK